MFLYRDMKYYDIVRQNIRKYRIKKKYTQQTLADKSNLSVDYICEIESSTKNKTFSIKTVGRIADALDMELYEFFMDELDIDTNKYSPYNLDSGGNNECIRK